MTPLTLSSPTKASLFRIILWRCLAASEHGITQPKPHDLFATRLAAQGLRAFIYLDIAAAAFLSASVGSELCVVIAASALPRAAADGFD